MGDPRIRPSLVLPNQAPSYSHSGAMSVVMRMWNTSREFAKSDRIWRPSICIADYSSSYGIRPPRDFSQPPHFIGAIFYWIYTTTSAPKAEASVLFITGPPYQNARAQNTRWCTKGALVISTPRAVHIRAHFVLPAPYPPGVGCVGKSSRSSLCSYIGPRLDYAPIRHVRGRVGGWWGGGAGGGGVDMGYYRPEALIRRRNQDAALLLRYGFEGGYKCPLENPAQLSIGPKLEASIAGNAQKPHTSWRIGSPPAISPSPLYKERTKAPGKAWRNFYIASKSDRWRRAGRHRATWGYPPRPNWYLTRTLAAYRM